VAFKTDEQQPFLEYEISQGRDYSEATGCGRSPGAPRGRALDHLH
jgi:hypothetical protein